MPEAFTGDGMPGAMEVVEKRYPRAGGSESGVCETDREVHKVFIEAAGDYVYRHRCITQSVSIRQNGSVEIRLLNVLMR